MSACPDTPARGRGGEHGPIGSVRGPEPRRPWRLSMLSTVPAAEAADRQLTSRQAQLARLVAAGMTNREVAGALRLSERTVESHLRRIYRRIGVRSRDGLQAWLSGRGRAVAAPAWPSRDPLTRREREVANLVAEG